jgi:hypothetical protein
MAKHVSTNNVNINGENYGERESGTDKNSRIQVVIIQQQKNLQEKKLSSEK